MDQSNSDMHGHGMPTETKTEKKQSSKNNKHKGKDATMFKQSENDELFNLVKTENGIIICCGKFRISSKSFKTFTDAELYISTKPYEILINLTCLMINLNAQNEKEQNSTKSAKND